MDSDPSSPSAEQAPDEAPAPVPTLAHRSPFDQRVTGALAGVWLALLLVQAWFVSNSDPLDQLEQPEAVITRAVLRQLALEVALVDSSEGGERPLLPDDREVAREDSTAEPAVSTDEQESDGEESESSNALSQSLTREAALDRAIAALIDGAERLQERAAETQLDVEDIEANQDARAADLDGAELLIARAALLAADAGREDWDGLLPEEPRDPALIDAVRASLAEDLEPAQAEAALAGLAPLGADYASSIAYARLERHAGDREAATAWDKLRGDVRARAQAVMVERIGAWLMPFTVVGLIAGVVLLMRGPSAWVLGRGAAPVRGIPTAMGLGAFFRYAVAFQAVGSLLALSGNSSIAISVFVGSLPLIAILGTLRHSLGGFDLRPILGLDLAPERTARVIPVALTAWTATLAALVMGSSLSSSEDTPVWSSPFIERVMLGGEWALWDLRLGAVIGAAMFEELAFRGLLFAGLRRRMNFAPAALISSALFAFAHGYEPGQQLAILWVGLVLSYTFERTRSLWPCVLAHAGYNLVQVEGLALFL